CFSKSNALRGIKNAFPPVRSMTISSGPTSILWIWSHLTDPDLTPMVVSVLLSFTVNVCGHGLNIICGMAIKKTTSQRSRLVLRTQWSVSQVRQYHSDTSCLVLVYVNPPRFYVDGRGRPRAAAAFIPLHIPSTRRLVSAIEQH